MLTISSTNHQHFRYIYNNTELAYLSKSGMRILVEDRSQICYDVFNSELLSVHIHKQMYDLAL